MTVFRSISNQIEFHLLQNRRENCHHDHIPFNLKGNGNIVFSVRCRFFSRHEEDEENPIPSERLGIPGVSAAMWQRQLMKLNSGSCHHRLAVVVLKQWQLPSQAGSCYIETYILLFIPLNKYNVKK